jgi:DNA-binding IclR family transcriptional regulator
MSRPPGATGELPEGQRIEALQQAAELLALFRPGVPELGLKELAEGLGMKEASARRVAANLEHAGLLERGRGGGYRLGLPLWRLGVQTLSNREIWDEARGVLTDLVREVGADGLIAVYHDGEALYIETVRANGQALGRAYPAHATALGKALLAHLPTDELRRAISERGLPTFTGRTITEAARLDRDLAAVRDRGYALEDEEYQPGLRALGVPVRDHAGQVVAAIGLGGDTEQLPGLELEALGRRVVAAGEAVSSRLGAGEEKGLAPLRLRIERRGGPRDPQAVISRVEADDGAAADAPATQPAESAAESRLA